MKALRSLRFLLLALLLSVIPASSYAGVFISVAIAPPVLPVYVQPPCPEPGWMWTPGYWAYGPDGYYWVPGTWVPAPYEGALWTPGYWGWSAGLYVWHPGYWGPHVGYYGGVNYGFGYMGVGFAGGMWVGGAFRYNTAVVNVNRTVIHNTYEDRTIIRNTTIVNDRHVAFSGGPGGINHVPTAQETVYMHDQHMAPTSFQTQHETTARADVGSYANHNGGHPNNLVMARPMNMNAGAHANIGSQSSGAGAGKVTMNEQSHGNFNDAPQRNSNSQLREQQGPQFHPAPQPQSHSAPPAPQEHQAQPHEGEQHGGGGQPHNEGGHEHGH